MVRILEPLIAMATRSPNFESIMIARYFGDEAQGRLELFLKLSHTAEAVLRPFNQGVRL